MMAEVIEYFKKFAGKSTLSFEYNLFVVCSNLFDLALPVTHLKFHIYLI